MPALSKDIQNSTDNYQHRVLPNGTENPKYVDLLDEDKSIAGQKFVCISFISPEKIIQNKNIFLFNEFVKQWELSKGFEKYTQFLHYISYKYEIKFDDLNADLLDFCESEKDKIVSTTMDDDYKNFIEANEERLDKEFGEAHSFETSVRGVKIRGSYPTQEEAELRCKMIREVDPDHDVYVGPVGLWMPFHPEAYKTGRVEYLEDELNQLMHEKNKNESAAKQQFDKRVKDTKLSAIKENERKAIESGNKLTQTVDDQGELVSISNTITTTQNLLESAPVADLQKELFEGDNIVTDKNSDHGLSNIMDNLKEQEKTKSDEELLTIDNKITD